MMFKIFTKYLAIGSLALNLGAGSVMAAEDCASGVSSALDQQRQRYIAAQSDLASQNFSKRPGSFASTTCLDNLMTQGGMDIFFKPPSLDNIIGMVKNLACEQASQIFDSLLSGGGLNSGSLQPGEIMQGLNFGGNLLSSMSGSTGSSNGTGGVSGFIQSLVGGNGTAGTSQGTTNTVSSSLNSVFN